VAQRWQPLRQLFIVLTVLLFIRSHGKTNIPSAKLHLFLSGRLLTISFGQIWIYHSTTLLKALFPEQPGWATIRQVKTFWILTKQEMMGWLQLDYMQIICTSLETDNHVSTKSLKILQAGCSSWCPTNSVKALKAAICSKWNTNRIFSTSLLTRLHQHFSTQLVMIRIS